MRRKPGYSLLELLVVIAIIGILATVGTYAWNSSGKRSRDSIRKSDLSRMNNALQQHYLDNRAYPSFDNNANNGRLYAAGWQLLGGNLDCPHGDKASFLTPKYLSEIPQDPKRFTNFGKTVCDGLVDQHSHYLYLASDKDSENPRQFALLATMEASPNELLDLAQNPIFGQGYSGPFEEFRIGGSNDFDFDQNYMLTGSNGR